MTGLPQGPFLIGELVEDDRHIFADFEKRVNRIVPGLWDQRHC